jgi:hypothetical protein
MVYGERREREEEGKRVRWKKRGRGLPFAVCGETLKENSSLGV